MKELRVNHDVSFSPARWQPGPGCELSVVSRPPTTYHHQDRRLQDAVPTTTAAV